MASISGTIDLPPGFRFHPTDEEIITHYLSTKVVNPRFGATAVGEVDLNKCEPWDLPSKAKMGEKEWYFFCKRDKKYTTGMRTNRATESGYWKATGKDKEIFRDKGVLVGMKKTLVFYMGRAPKDEKTNWVMHEFRLEGKQLPYIRTSKDKWVVCKIFQKRVASVAKSPITRINSFSEYMPELSPFIDPTLFNSFSIPELSYVQDEFDLDYGVSNRHNQVGIFNPPQTSVFFPQIQTSSAHFQFPAPTRAGYMHQNLPVMRAVATTDVKGHCKAEQFSSHSMVSGETGQSTDMNTEIALDATKHCWVSCHSFDDLGNPDELLTDLDNIWK